MKKILLIVMPMLVLWSCKKDDPECPPVNATAPAGEVTTLRNYIQANNIIAVEHSSGIFYRIERTGNADKPTPCSDVEVDYVGRLTTGSQFDAANGASFNLSQLITGWKIGIPLVGAGGRIILYIPPSLGYGSRNAGAIPANSILIFTIDLKSFR